MHITTHLESLWAGTAVTSRGRSGPGDPPGADGRGKRERHPPPPHSTAAAPQGLLSGAASVVGPDGLCWGCWDAGGWKMGR